MNADQLGIADADPHHFMPSHQREADKNLLVKFFTKPRQDMAETEKQGRPIYKDVEYVDIKIPGNRNSGACRPATQADKQRFPDHYRAFKDRITEDYIEGTLLAEWPLISRSMAQELTFFHVKTVEQLATMADGQAAKFMGLAGIRQKAKTWLEAAKKDKPLWEMDEKIKAQAAEIEDLKQALADVVHRVELGQTGDGETEAQKARMKKRAMEAAKKKAS